MESCAIYTFHLIPLDQLKKGISCMATGTWLRIYKVHKKKFDWKNLKILEQPKYKMEDNKRKGYERNILVKGLTELWT